MVLIFTEEQKTKIEENGYFVIQIKQIIYKLKNITIPKLSRGTFSGGYYLKYFYPKETECIGRMPSIGNKEKVRDCYDKNRF